MEKNLNRRNILKNSLFLGLGFTFFSKLNSIASLNNATDVVLTSSANLSLTPPFSLPKLNYDFKALEPNIDALTMEIHYTKHHKAYIDNLNKAIENTDFAKMNLNDILKNLKGDKKENPIRNNAGGHFNHTFWWDILTPKQTKTEPTAELLNQINKDFGSLDKFKIAFENEAKSRFGSGWAWLIYDKTDKKLKVTNTANQDNTLMGFSDIKGQPILGLDVWEHAYYLKYQNKRADYITAFWKVLDWNKAESYFKSAISNK